MKRKTKYYTESPRLVLRSPTTGHPDGRQHDDHLSVEKGAGLPGRPPGRGLLKTGTRKQYNSGGLEEENSKECNGELGLGWKRTEGNCTYAASASAPTPPGGCRVQPPSQHGGCVSRLCALERAHHRDARPGKRRAGKKRAALERPLSGRMLHGLKSTQKYFTLLQSRLGTSGPENLGTETEMN